jgi:hypothetical protein
MPPPTVHSAFRSWCATGIGDSPRSGTIGSGDQYLDMDLAPWTTTGLPERLQSWLTLTIPKELPQHVGSSLEVWMAAPVQGWQFVGCLRPFGREQHGRLSYFAHGRGWRDDEWTDPEFDGGTWIGDSRAFDTPRATQKAATPSIPPESAARLLAFGRLLRDERHRALATTLAAWLYQAIDQRQSVICFAPIEAFVGGHPFASLVAVARAALPWEVRRSAKIRLYTHTPAGFLADGVHLLALVKDESAAALPMSPNIVALELRGDTIAGPDAHPFYGTYASEVIKGATAKPQVLLAFGGNTSRRLESALGERTPLATSVAAAYDIVVAGREGTYDTWLVENLARRAKARKALPLAWNELITDDEWNRFSTDTLIDVALTPAPTADSLALRASVWAALDRRRTCVDTALQAIWAPRAPNDEVTSNAADLTARARDLIALLESTSSVVSGTAAARLLRTLPASAVRDLLLDEACGRSFARLVADADLPESWQSSTITSVEANQAARMLVHAAASDRVARWRGCIDAWIVTMVRARQVPSDIVGIVARIGASAERLDAAVASADILCSDPARGSELGVHLAAFERRALTREERQALVALCSGGTSPFLESHVPSVAILHMVGRDLLADLAPWLDRRMASTVKKTTGVLVKNRVWGTWAAASTDPEARYKSAIVALESQAAQSLLTDWSQLVKSIRDLLTSQDVERITHRREGSIREVASNYRLQLIECAKDLTAVALLAETETPFAYGRAEAMARSSTPLFAGLPDGILNVVAGRPLTSALSLPQFEWLLDRSGQQRRPQATTIAVDLLLSTIAGQSQPISRSESDVWSQADVVNAALDWLQRHVADGESYARVLAWLPQQIKSLHKPRVAHRKPVAGAGGAVRADSPPVDSVVSDRVLEAALQSLWSGEYDPAPWEELANRCLSIGSGARHPIADLAAMTLRLPAEQRQGLSLHGARILDVAAQAHRWLGHVPPAYDGALPILLLLLRVDPEGSLPDSAFRVVRWQGSLPDRDWFHSLLRAIREGTRLTGGRGPDDSPDIAIERLVVKLKRDKYCADSLRGLLAQMRRVPAPSSNVGNLL